jgi:small-conductance mechanosensitive channel
LDEVRDNINVGILQRFREEDITIPFPQRDVYQYQVPYRPEDHLPDVDAKPT